VKLHRNAKTTPYMRALLVHRVRTLQWPVAAAAGAAGIALRTALNGWSVTVPVACSRCGMDHRSPIGSPAGRRPP
jgi:leucine-zipper of insertion element IS481